MRPFAKSMNMPMRSVLYEGNGFETYQLTTYQVCTVVLVNGGRYGKTYVYIIHIIRPPVSCDVFVDGFVVDCTHALDRAVPVIPLVPSRGKSCGRHLLVSLTPGIGTLLVQEPAV